MCSWRSMKAGKSLPLYPDWEAHQCSWARDEGNIWSSSPCPGETSGTSLWVLGSHSSWATTTIHYLLPQGLQRTYYSSINSKFLPYLLDHSLILTVIWTAQWQQCLVYAGDTQQNLFHTSHVHNSSGFSRFWVVWLKHGWFFSATELACSQNFYAVWWRLLYCSLACKPDFGMMIRWQKGFLFAWKMLPSDGNGTINSLLG